MDNSIRLQYLEAMGIDVWIPRVPAPIEPFVKESVPSASDSKDQDTADREQSSWTLLQNQVATCTRCTLCETRTQTVFGTGNQLADWMIIGEAPGQHEDLQGKPFVGNAGSLLTEMLHAVGLPRDEVFITNILKCRPPGNRDPKQEEADRCHEYLLQQVMLLKPKIILAVGRIAAQHLLKTDEPLAKLRGKKHAFNATPVVVVYHPAYLLRALSEKRKAWLDLLLAMRIYNEIKG